MIRTRTGQRILALVAIASGSLAVGLFFKFSRKPSIPESEATSMGYASVADLKKTSNDFGRYWPDILGHGRLTDWEYQLAVETLSHGSRAAQVRIVVVLGYLQGDTERKRALAMMPKEAIPAPMFGVWRSSFRRWMKSPRDESVLGMLTESGNVNAIKAADELRKAGNASS